MKRTPLSFNRYNFEIFAAIEPKRINDLHFEPILTFSFNSAKEKLS